MKHVFGIYSAYSESRPNQDVKASLTLVHQVQARSMTNAVHKPSVSTVK